MFPMPSIVLPESFSSAVTRVVDSFTAHAEYMAACDAFSEDDTVDSLAIAVPESLANFLTPSEFLKKALAVLAEIRGHIGSFSVVKALINVSSVMPSPVASNPVAPTNPVCPAIEPMRAEIAAADDAWADLDLDVISGARRVLAEHAKVLATAEEVLLDMRNPNVKVFHKRNKTEVTQAQFQEVVDRQRTLYNAAIAPAEQQLRQEQLEKNALLMKKRVLVKQYCQNIDDAGADYQKTAQDRQYCRARP